jgi:hypothetical protein
MDALGRGADFKAMFLQLAAPASPEAVASAKRFDRVIEMLKDLSSDFTQTKTDIGHAETAAADAFKVLMEQLRGQSEESQKQVDEKKDTFSANTEEIGKNQAQLASDAADAKTIQAGMEERAATGDRAVAAFKARQELRANEIEAIEKAIEIMTSDDVGDVKQHLPKFLHLASQAQIKVRSALQYLEHQGTSLRSALLSAVAEQAKADPFEKVRNMVNELIDRLINEAAADAEQKTWCMKELATNEATRDTKTAELLKLSVERDGLNVEIAKKDQKIKEIIARIEEIDQAVAEATKTRAEEKKTNEATIDDAAAGIDAVGRAVTVLKEFYEKAAGATALVAKEGDVLETIKRTNQKDLFTTPYQGMQSKNGGVVGMLEVIQTDMQRLKSETEAAEAEAQSDYNDFMKESETEKLQQTRTKENTEMDKLNLEQELEDNQASLKGTDKELQAALKTFDKLKPPCIDSGVSYADRVEQRNEEIKSLEEALKILNE